MAPSSESLFSNGTSSASKPKHVIIIGAGLTGLILAQALRNVNRKYPVSTYFTFGIYERDARAFARGGGWSLTIHWALTDLRNVLPIELIERFDECLVNPEAAENKNPGNFQFLNLKTAEKQEAWPIPLGAASRVAREKLMALLMEGLDIQVRFLDSVGRFLCFADICLKWSKCLNQISHPTDSTVTAHFEDGTSATGDLLIGCDGSNSAVRRNLCPTIHQTNRLPVRLIGLRVEYPVSEIQKCLAIDPHFFQGGDPVSNVYFWFSFIDLPRSTDKTTTATCQMMMSWPYRKGFLGKDKPLEMPESTEEKLALMRDLSKDWAHPFKELVYSIPKETDLREIVLADWLPERGSWDNHNGTVSLVGDAAHSMTMCKSTPSSVLVIPFAT